MLFVSHRCPRWLTSHGRTYPELVLGPRVFETAVWRGRASSRLSELLGAPVSLACGHITPVPASITHGLFLCLSLLRTPFIALRPTWLVQADLPCPSFADVAFFTN